MANHTAILVIENDVEESTIQLPQEGNILGQCIKRYEVKLYAQKIIYSCLRTVLNI